MYKEIEGNLITLGKEGKEKALQFVKDMSLYLGMEYDGKHFEDLWHLGYLPIKVKALPEGIETFPNIPHMTFINTVDGFAWLTLYLETIVSSFTYQYNTRDSLGFAAKGAWFEVEKHKCKFNGKGCTKYPEGGVCADYLEDECGDFCKKSYNIYKDPVTDDGVKRSLKGLLQVKLIDNEYIVNQECSWEQEEDSELRTIYENGKFYNITDLSEIRKKLNNF